MDIHEYQAKEILANFGVEVPPGALAYSPEQAAYRARELGGAEFGAGRIPRQQIAEAASRISNQHARTALPVRHGLPPGPPAAASMRGAGARRLLPGGG